MGPFERLFHAIITRCADVRRTESWVWRHNDGGITYFRPWRFSINEGWYPNVFFCWDAGCRPFIYFAISDRLRWNSRRWSFAKRRGEPA